MNVLYEICVHFGAIKKEKMMKNYNWHKNLRWANLLEEYSGKYFPEPETDSQIFDLEFVRREMMEDFQGVQNQDFVTQFCSCDVEMLSWMVAMTSSVAATMVALMVIMKHWNRSLEKDSMALRKKKLNVEVAKMDDFY